MFSQNINEEKKNLRAKVKSSLKTKFESEDFSSLSARICENVSSLKQFAASDVVLAYIPLKLEADCSILIEKAKELKKIVAVPRVVPKTSRMDFFILNDEISLSEQLEPGSFGIMEPKKNLNQFLPDLYASKKIFMILPGLAFSKKGERLGKGMGFYDRYIESLLKKCENVFLCGFCFESQLFEKLPSEKFDIPVDSVATEKSMFYFRESAE